MRRVQPHRQGLLRDPGDTLLGRWLSAYRRRRKRRLIRAPKFYFADVRVVNRLTRRGELAPGAQLYGKAFENAVFHELSDAALGRGPWRSRARPPGTKSAIVGLGP